MHENVHTIRFFKHLTEHIFCMILKAVITLLINKCRNVSVSKQQRFAAKRCQSIIGENGLHTRGSVNYRYKCR